MPGHDITEPYDFRRRFHDLDRRISCDPRQKFAGNRSYQICSLNGSDCSLKIRHVDCDLTFVAHSGQRLVRRYLNPTENSDADMFQLQVLSKRKRLWETPVGISHANKLFF